jgi:hypothetical protein
MLTTVVVAEYALEQYVVVDRCVIKKDIFSEQKPNTDHQHSYSILAGSTLIGNAKSSNS